MSAPKKKGAGGRPPKPVPRSPRLTRALKDSTRKISTMEAKLAAEHAAREQLVHDAIEEGFSHSAIADLCGFNKSRVSQIVARAV